jgi:hypothetical protein
MKKLILVFLFLSQFSFGSSWPKAKVTYKDGTIKEGFVDFPNISDDKIKFKETIKGDTEKIIADDLKEIYFTFEDGTHSRLVRFKWAMVKNKKGELRIGDAQWFGATYLGKTANFVSITRYNPGILNIYYLNIPGNDYAVEMFYENEAANAVIGNRKMYQLVADTELKDACPDFIAAINVEDLKIKKFKEFLKLYIDNCE